MLLIQIFTVDRADWRAAKEFALKFMIPIACLLVLEACAAGSDLAKPVSPAEVAALEEGVIVADMLALDYMKLPTCPAAAPMCSVAATRETSRPMPRGRMTP
jgi:hypothetical protein